jgi:hypothetical protein
VLTLVMLGLVWVGPVVGQERVVVVGDLHGSYAGLVSILSMTGLVDQDRHWSGGEATLVQMGDILDRGEQLRQTLDLLMQLQVEAEAAGGRVIVLLGNHEVMDMLGVIREVHPQAWATFADEQSARRRSEAYAEFKRFQISRARTIGGTPPVFSDEVEQQWMASFPLGKVEYMQAFLPDGRYGRWLRQCPTIIRIGGTVLVHAGISPEIKGISLDEINRQVADELATFDEARARMAKLDLVQPTSSVHVLVANAKGELQRLTLLGRNASPRERQLRPLLQDLMEWESWFLADKSSPLWYPGPAYWDETEDAEEVAELLDSFGAKHLVAAHIPSRDGRVRCRFGGRVIVVDTGIEHQRFAGREAALEISNGVFTAIYPDRREVLVEADDQSL